VLPRGGEGRFSSTMGLPEGRNKGYLEEVRQRDSGTETDLPFPFYADPDSQIQNPNFYIILDLDLCIFLQNCWPIMPVACVIVIIVEKDIIHDCDYRIRIGITPLFGS
jgi:hypothetical protein